MNTSIQSNIPPLTTTPYDVDSYEWATDQIVLMRSGQLDKLDIMHLIEEMEEMVSSAKSRVFHQVVRLMTHLLKWEHQPQLRKGGNISWQNIIADSRNVIIFEIRKSKNINKYFTTSVDECYDDARRVAAAQTRLPQTTFPETCPWSVQDLLDYDFFPGIPLELKPLEKKKKGEGKRNKNTRKGHR